MSYKTVQELVYFYKYNMNVSLQGIYNICTQNKKPHRSFLLESKSVPVLPTISVLSEINVSNFQLSKLTTKQLNVWPKSEDGSVELAYVGGVYSSEHTYNLGHIG